MRGAKFFLKLWKTVPYLFLRAESLYYRTFMTHCTRLQYLFEVSDISKMTKEPNSNSIDELVSQALCSMNNTADLFPKEVRFVLSQIRNTTAAKWPNQDNLSLRVVANFLFLRFISAGMTSPVSHGLCQQPPTAIGQKVLTKVAKILQSTANFTNSTPMTNRKIGGSDIQSETAELIMRLSNQPENVKLTPNQNRIISLKECRRNPNRQGSEYKLNICVGQHTIFL